MNNKFDIFISYRRQGGYDTAKHLNDLLVRDGYRVSFDVDTLRSGDFDTQLYERIDQCKDFIVIVDSHAFDRTLDPNTNPQEDWLRCELAYALKKNKNIIPVFLAGANGFPKGLPEDVVGVVKKNGPEYNRYHFNAFYADLKKRFLKSRTLKPYLIGLGVCAIVTCIVGMAMWMLYLSKQTVGPIVNDTTEQVSKLPYPEIETTIPWSEAKSIVRDVLLRDPLMAVGYKEEKEKIVALFDLNPVESNMTPLEVWGPELQLVVLSKEAGVWSKENEKNLDMKKFEDIGAYIFIFNDTCSILHTENQHFLYFHFKYSGGIEVQSEKGYDYVALNVADGSYTQISYFVDLDRYSFNGELHKEESYPEGIEQYLLSKLEADNEAVKIGTDVADKERMYRDWFADNPQCYNLPKEFDYGVKHDLIVKMYDTSPDCENCDTIIIGHYIIYNNYDILRAAGNVYGFDKKTKKYFPIWVDRNMFSQKVIEVVGDHVIRMTYNDDYWNVGDTIDAVVYDLDEKSYYYEQHYIDSKLSN